MTNRAPNSRRWPPSLRRALAIAALAAPCAGAAELNCERSVAYHARWCAGSVIVSVTPAQASGVCTAFTRELAARCRPSWDRFGSCAEFASRFEEVLVDACLARKVAPQSCRDWGQAFAVGPLARCENGKTGY